MPPISVELTCRIVDDLARQHDRNEIIQMVCEQAGLAWPQAEQVVSQVEADHAHAIAGKQNPLIILLSAAIVAAGIGILYFTFPPIPSHSRGSTLTMVILLVADYPYKFGFLSLAMIAGGIIGLYRQLLHYFST